VKKLLWLIWLFPLLVGCVLLVPKTAAPAPTAQPTREVASSPTPKPVETPAAVDLQDWDLYRRAMLAEFKDDVDPADHVTQYQITLAVDLDKLVVQGKERVHYTNRESVDLSEIVFRLLPNTPGYGGEMTVSQVAVGGVTADPELRLQGSALYVPLAAPLAPGREVEIELDFQGRIPADAEAGYAQYGYIDGVLALPDVYPMIPVFDDEGWNVELAPPYGDATFTDISLYLVEVALPSEMTLVTSGVIVGQRDTADGDTVYTCVSGPMRDFNLVASADYELQSAEVGQVQLNAYYRPGDSAGAERVLDYASDAVRFYAQILGAYPFTELDVVATPTQAGGIEYPGLIVVAQRLYGQAGGFFETVVVHEVAHQWWYGMVGNDQLDEPWLDEALTQYTTYLCFEHRYGRANAQGLFDNAFEGPYQSLLQSNQDMPVGLPVAAYSEELYSPVVYGKGPLFFHALRQQVGDERFIEILHTYFQEYRNGIAYPQDFLAVAERVSGQSLDALYKQWIVGE
jgi:aminopeptidase N